jgi:hypothetical protein
MFVFLNRLVKACVIALWIAAGAWVWSQREVGRPLLDLYQVWHECNYQEPPELPRLEGTVVKMLAPSTVQFRDEAGTVYTVGLTGWVGPDPVKTPPKAMRSWSTSMVAVISPRILGQPVHVAYTALQTNWVGYPKRPDRMVTGYLYVGTNTANLACALVSEGRIEMVPASVSILPLREQVAFRVAARQAAARKESNSDGAPTDPASTPPAGTPTALLNSGPAPDAESRRRL